MEDRKSPEILIVEEDARVLRALRDRLERALGCVVAEARSFQEARRLLDDSATDFFAAVIELRLPDARDGEILDYVFSKGIPPIVLTRAYDDGVREDMSSKDIIDYVALEDPKSIDHTVQIVQRILKNREIKLLVVEDSTTSRHHICNILRLHKFQVLEAVDGVDALAKIQRDPDVKLVITDYNMPGMDGFELVARIREVYAKDVMGIIGVSAFGSSALSARFLKLGANDFLTKPFSREELHCRVDQNIEIVELIGEIREASNRDYLTNLHNRRYLFEAGIKLYENAKRDTLEIAVGMIDIDRFKAVNDKYGHDAGDQALVHIARLLDDNIRSSDMVVRFGGEEFCVLACGISKPNALLLFGKIRRLVEQSDWSIGDRNVKLTVSIGVATRLGESFDEMIRSSDTLLYEAKMKGRNRVVIDV